MRAGVLAIIAGALLLFTAAASSTLIYDQIGEFVTDNWPGASDVVEVILQVLSFIASAGGLAIIVGGVLMLMGLERVGRLVVVIAAFAALVGFVLMVAVLIDRGEGDAGWWLDLTLLLSLVGIVLAFSAKPARA